MNGEQPTVFQGELQRLISRHSLENGSNTPDFVLALYLRRCLEAFDEATKRRAQWYTPDKANRVAIRSTEPGKP